MSKFVLFCGGIAEGDLAKGDSFGGCYVFSDDVKNKCLLKRVFIVYLFTLSVYL